MIYIFPMNEASKYLIDSSLISDCTLATAFGKLLRAFLDF